MLNSKWRNRKQYDQERYNITHQKFFDSKKRMWTLDQEWQGVPISEKEELLQIYRKWHKMPESL